MSTIFVFPGLAICGLKDLGAAVRARLGSYGAGANLNSVWSCSEVKLAFILTVDDAGEAHGMGLVGNTHQPFFLVGQSAMKVLLQASWVTFIVELHVICESLWENRWFSCNFLSLPV